MFKKEFVVDAGHRAIMFNRIGGVGDVVYKEGLHFRIPWFQYPIIYDIRARPNQIRSPTGSKDLQVFSSFSSIFSSVPHICFRKHLFG